MNNNHYGLFLLFIVFILSSCGSSDKELSKEGLGELIRKELRECMFGDSKKGLNSLLEMQDKYKNNAEVEFSIGGCMAYTSVYKKTRDMQDISMIGEVEKHFLKAIEIDSNNYTYQIQLGLLYEESEKYEEAIRLFLPLLRNGPLTVNPKFMIYSVNLVNCVYQLGDKKNAFELLETNLSRNNYDKRLVIASLEWMKNNGEYSELKYLADNFIRRRSLNPRVFKSCQELLDSRLYDSALSCYQDFISKSREIKEIKGSDSLIFHPPHASLPDNVLEIGKPHGSITPLRDPRSAATRHPAR